MHRTSILKQSESGSLKQNKDSSYKHSSHTLQYKYQIILMKQVMKQV